MLFCGREDDDKDSKFSSWGSAVGIWSAVIGDCSYHFMFGGNLFVFLRSVMSILLLLLGQFLSSETCHI